MRDIYFAMALMAAVSAGMLLAGLALGRKLGPKAFAAVALVVCEIGDPAVGRETWRLEDLRVLWHGEGMRLTTE